MFGLWQLIGFAFAGTLAGAGLGFMLLRSDGGIAMLKGLVSSFIGGLFAFHFLPESFEKLGAMSLVYLVLGFVIMLLLEGRLIPFGNKGKDPETHAGRIFTSEILWVVLIIHQIIDGMGLALSTQSFAGDPVLALALIAHRIPVAAVVLWLFYRSHKPSQAWLRLGAMVVATMVGALFYDSLGNMMNQDAVAIAYPLFCGTFLHFLTHNFVDHHAHQERDRKAEFGGFALGVLFLVLSLGVMPEDHQALEAAGAAHAHAGLDSRFFEVLLTLLAETAPYLLLGLLVSGLMFAFMPQTPFEWMRKGSPLTQSFKGMTFGLPLPICSCGVLPLFLSLTKKGVPPAAAVAFLIATPELGIDSFLLSVKLLGWKFSMVRLVVAILLPVLIALAAVKFLNLGAANPEPISEKSCCGKSHGPSLEQKKPWWRFAFVDMVDDIFPLVFFGLLVAALAQTLWPTSSLGSLVGHWDVLLLGLLGIPFYVCASASVPFALVLLEHNFSIGAVVVFLFAGPATNVATILTVNKAFGPKSGLKLASLALVIATTMGFAINGLYQPGQLDTIELHQHGLTPLDMIFLAIMFLLALGSMWRFGPLHWISVVAGLIPGVVHHPSTNGNAGKQHA